VDSNDFHVLAWAEAFENAGYEFERQTIHDQIGKGSDMLVPSLLPELDEVSVNALGDGQGEIYQRKYLHQVRPFRGARDLLARSQQSGQQVVLASSASQPEVDQYLKLLDCRQFVTATTSADDVEHSKPAPDIFAMALKKVAPLSASEVMVVGDTPYDVEAAAKCGIASIAVRSGKFPDDALRIAGASAIYDDVASLLADFDGSPLAMPG
jgi:HAD superfamily hydrolase (TIGR01509 family)